MTRGFWRDPERYLDTYWRRFPGIWTHGDWASVDEDGYWFLHGRSDDTLNIAGKRIGPAEIESAAVAHPAVSEAAAVGIPHEVKGEVAWVFCALVPGREPGDELAAEIKAAVAGSSERRSSPTACSSSAPCRRREAPRSCGVRCGRRRSGPTRATCRHSRTPRPWRRSPMPSEPRTALVTGGGRDRRRHRPRARRGRLVGRRRSAIARPDRGGRTGDRRAGRRARCGGPRVRGARRRRGGDVDLLVANAGIGGQGQPTWEAEPEDCGASSRSTSWASICRAER